MPQSENPQAKEILQQKTENDELKRLVIKMTTQIKEMESQIEAFMQENENLKKAQQVFIPTMIPTISTTVPSTLAEHLAPQGVLETAVPITSHDISASSSSTSQINTVEDKAAIIRAMEDMSLKDKEILSLKGIIKNLKTSKRDTLITSKGHEQRADRLQEQVKILQQQVNLTNQVAYIKNHLWTKIIEGIHSQWPSIQIIYEQKELLQVANTEIDKTKKEIENKPPQAVQLIAFLNSKNREELKELKIADRIEAIL